MNETTLAPAAAIVDGGETPLFNAETLQLTDEVVSNLTAIGLDASLFAFGADLGAVVVEKRSGACKVFPDDQQWPSPSTWNLLDLLSGKRLIATIPSASSCYNDWPAETNPGECSYATSNWNSSFFQ